MTLPHHSGRVEPIRQGFVGYLNAGKLCWRVMVRLRLGDEVWWRGRLWFSEPGGTEVWDQAELLGRSPEEVLRQARGFSAPELVRRFNRSYDERRRYFALRALLDDVLEKGRMLNRAAALAGAAGEVRPGPSGAQLDRLQQEMKELVDGIRAVAGQEGRLRL